MELNNEIRQVNYYRRLRTLVLAGWLKCLNQEAPQFSQKAPKKAPKFFSPKSACILGKSTTDLTPQTIFIAFLCIKVFQLETVLKISNIIFETFFLFTYFTSYKPIDVIKKSTFSKFEHLCHLQKHLFGDKAPFLATLNIFTVWPIIPGRAPEKSASENSLVVNKQKKNLTVDSVINWIFLEKAIHGRKWPNRNLSWGFTR